jgi:PAS domain S-box-containing protein
MKDTAYFSSLSKTKPETDSVSFDQGETGYRLLVENANDAIFIMVDGFIVFHNRKTELLTGYCADELSHTPFSVLVHLDDRGRLIREIKTTDQATLTFRIIDKSGNELWCQAGFVSITWDKKQGILWFVRDITRQKALENQLQQSQKMEALGTLVAGIAHEINNPVNLIMYNIPILKNVWDDLLPVLTEAPEKTPGKKYGGLTVDFLNENLHQLLSDVDMAANRIAKIINELKNFSKQSNATEKKIMDINLAVQNALRLAQSTIKKSRIRMELVCNPSLPQIEANVHSIEQVILNILINAIQAIDHDNGVIKIKTGYQSKDGQVFISISDNGRGINPSLENKIFDPFVTDKQMDGGTGLGLAVSYNLVKAHGGKITFKNLSEGGTDFTISLPVRVFGKTYKILIADDDELVREILMEILSKNRNYFVDEAFNGIEACIKMGTFQPDLLILDVLMPEMDGLEVCRTITRSEDLKKLKVIITTGYPDHPKVKELESLGFTHIYGKPFDLKEFCLHVDKILTT